MPVERARRRGSLAKGAVAIRRCTVERDAVSPSLERSDGSNRSREEDSVAAEAEPSGGQLLWKRAILGLRSRR